MELLNITYCLLYKSKRQFECFTEEEFEDTKGVIRIRNQRRTDNTIVKRKRVKR